MKNTHIVILVVVLLAIGAWFVFGKSKKAEAPASQIQTESQSQSSTTNTSSASAVKEFTVTGQNFSFSPSMITVKKGDRVKITFQNTSGFHNFVIDEFGVATPTKKSPDTEVIEFTADKIGSFQYYCAVGSHKAMGMWGTLKVE